jgi:hypothetical protein
MLTIGGQAKNISTWPWRVAALSGERRGRALENGKLGFESSGCARFARGRLRRA